MARTQEDLVVQWSGIAARRTVNALDPTLTDQQKTAATNNAAAADTNLERARTNGRPRS